MEGLLTTFLNLIETWDKSFSQLRTAKRSKALAISLFLALGRKTFSRAIAAAGRDKVDWSADYRLFSRSSWSPCDLFRPILQSACERVDDSFITIAYDDTLIRKSGKKIKATSWQRDPLSPPFCVNFVWGIRYLQASLLLPLYQDGHTPPRAIPVQFSQLPKFKRPSKKAPKEEWDKYEELIKRYNASTHFVKHLRYLRNELNMQGYKDKKLLVPVDGSYCNRTCLTADIPNTEIIGRTRKNARLYYRSKEGCRTFYNPKSFTPEEIRADDLLAYQGGEVFYGSKWRGIRYKEVKQVFWKHGTKRKPLRLIVIAPMSYRLNKKGRLHYRDPAYLLTTDLETDALILIQKYLDRWQIEVNFKEEKDLMGLGQQQVWSERSIPKAPAFVVASYSALLLSSVLQFNDQRDPKIFADLPKWRNKKSKRPSCLDLMTLIRRELAQHPQLAARYNCIATEKNMVYKSAA